MKHNDSSLKRRGRSRCCWGTRKAKELQKRSDDSFRHRRFMTQIRSCFDRYNARHLTHAANNHDRRLVHIALALRSETLVSLSDMSESPLRSIACWYVRLRLMYVCPGM